MITKLDFNKQGIVAKMLRQCYQDRLIIKILLRFFTSFQYLKDHWQFLRLV